MKRFLAALQFLTLIPIQLETAVSLGRAAMFFPLVGAMLGGLAGFVSLSLRSYFGESVASLLAITCLLGLTGGLHEDGLADVADGCRAGRSPETILRIMKDSRIGTYGSLALVSCLLLRWQALARCRINPALGLSAALTISRTGIVVLAGLSRPVGDGLGASFVRDLSKRGMYVAITLGSVVVVLLAGWLGLLMVGCGALIVLTARVYFAARLGGVTGDCLGATCQILETVNLLILAWQPYM